MNEKVKLEKLNLVNRHDLIADETFNGGQALLQDLNYRMKEADERKNRTIEKTKNF